MRREAGTDRISNEENGLIVANSGKALLAAYMFLGDDGLKISTLMKRMRQRVAAYGDLDFNESVFDAASLAAPEEVVAACRTVPFLSDKRLVVVRDVDSEKAKGLQDALAAYLADPMDSTVLVLTAAKLAKNRKLYKALEALGAGAIIDCASKTRRGDLRSFVAALAADHGLSMGPHAVDSLIERVGSSSTALNSELAKLAEYASAQGRNSATEADVADLVARREPPKPWEVVDAMSERDAARALRLYMQMGSKSPLGVFTMCVKRMRELIAVKALAERPVSEPIEKVLGGQEWMYRRHGAYAARFSGGELVRALEEAAESEAAMKSGLDPELGFTLWVSGVCTGRWAEAS